jgi:hypothetical protein
MYVENVYNGFIYNLAHHRMSAIIRYLWARKYTVAAVPHGVPHHMDPVGVIRFGHTTEGMPILDIYVCRHKNDSRYSSKFDMEIIRNL